MEKRILKLQHYADIIQIRTYEMEAPESDKDGFGRSRREIEEKSFLLMCSAITGSVNSRQTEHCPLRLYSCARASYESLKIEILVLENR